MNENQSLLDLEVNEPAATGLVEATRWGKFLATISLIAFGLFILLFLFLWKTIMGLFMTGGELDGQSGDLVMVVFVVMMVAIGAIVAILMSFLIKAAIRIRNGIQNKDQYLFNSGLANLRNYFVMYGVISILGILFTAIGFLNR